MVKIFKHEKGINTIKRLTPLKAIRTKCLECSGGRKAVHNCEAMDCPLFSFKEGRNPYRKGCGRISNIFCKT